MTDIHHRRDRHRRLAWTHAALAGSFLLALGQTGPVWSQDAAAACQGGGLDRAAIARCSTLLGSGTLQGEGLARAAEWRMGAHFATGDYVNAAYDADIYANLWPDLLLGYYVGCLARGAGGFDLDTAERLCETAMRLTDDPSVFSVRGILRLKQNRNQDAWADFDRHLQASPRTAQAAYGRGIAAMRLGRVSEGRADIAAAADMDREMNLTDPQMFTTEQFYTAWGLVPPQR
ncbi:hypothetical protein [Brevundimonas sp.]|uniref:hypothetical protein n=1 Tax=Brevundimonas sp. TaxID=1871086 RepID=UPI002ABBF125|nr:hypothetical protein [Brevundimonas sp.]MDZ4364062.1 hypothetical protein [Brevundimonas sp.]